MVQYTFVFSFAVCVNGVLQELIRAQSSSLAPLFDKGAHVYVCGDAKVRKATPTINVYIAICIDIDVEE